MITSSGPGATDLDEGSLYLLWMGTGDDTVTVDAAATQPVYINGEDGNDTIRAWMGTSVWSGDDDDQITLGILPDHVTAGRAPAFIRDLYPEDRLILEIDRELTGELTAVYVPFYDDLDDGPFTEIRIGDVTVAIIDQVGFQLDDPRLTVTRNVTFT